MGTVIPSTNPLGDPAESSPSDPPPPTATNTGSAEIDFDVVSHRYFDTGEWELVSSDGVKFRITPQHLHGSTLYDKAQHSHSIELKESYADHRVVHLLLDFQSAAMAAGVVGSAVMSPASGDSGLGSSVLASRSASTISSTAPTNGSNGGHGSNGNGNGANGHSDGGSNGGSARNSDSGNGNGHNGRNSLTNGGNGPRHPRPSPLGPSPLASVLLNNSSRHTSLSSLPSASAASGSGSGDGSGSASPSSTPSRDALAAEGLDRLVPALMLAHAYEFPVECEILQAVSIALRDPNVSPGCITEAFVAAAKLDSPDLAEAAVRAMAGGEGRTAEEREAFSPWHWDLDTYKAVSKDYYWALKQCFVTTEGVRTINEERFMAALWEYRTITNLDALR